MGILMFAILIGIIPAAIAYGKGKSFFAWWLFGTLLFIVALPMAIIAKEEPTLIEHKQRAVGMKKCRFCAEMIKPDAVVCRYCGRDLTPVKKQTPKEQKPADTINCPLCSKPIYVSAIHPGSNNCPYCYGEYVAEM